jgi:2-polyprenyl-3-methyl-5-hydroxy-6-metoxy-1,4-benzoquinol methylase
MWLKERSGQKELLDETEIPREDLFRNLRELDYINRKLGGYKASKQGLSTILKDHPGIRTVLDVGFGGGDFMRELDKAARAQKAQLFFYGVDLKQDCVEYAAENLRGLPNKDLICNDYREIPAALLQKADVLHCSLFLHHLSNDEIIDLFRFAKAHHCILVANDLQRHYLAFSSIRLLTALFSRSYLVKNDAPVSVRRGFRKKELETLLEKAGFSDFTVKWTWAFRYLVIAKP